MVPNHYVKQGYDSMPRSGAAARILTSLPQNIKSSPNDFMSPHSFFHAALLQSSAHSYSEDSGFALPDHIPAAVESAMSAFPCGRP